ncbi:WLM domain-containing protein, partial [Staphylotrichum tortipilum]
MDTSEPTGDTHMDSLPPINEEQLPEKDTHDRHIEDNFVAEDANGETITLTIKFPPENHNQEWIFFSSDTLWDLFDDLSDTFPSYNWSKAKALIEKRPPYLKPVYVSPTDDDLPLATLDTITLRILAPKTSALEALTSARAASAARQSARASLRARRIAAIPSRPSPQATTYTFYTLRPLPHLPNPSTALALLQRLKSDPGIRAAMQAHHFTVGLLTEMDPSQHTAASHTGVTRILGLNRNRGQVIELRLRTDAYDGWRDYRTIRKTLCHELAHNVHSEHDGKFWELCKRIEREVERADWTRGGRTVGGEGVEFA